MRRAGERGTQILLDLLVEAPTFAERRAYMQALEHTDAGTEMLVGMLDHHEWFVVRNVADLAGEMKLVSAIPALGKAGEHEDHRVRLSAGLALSKIGTPAVMKYLGALLRDPHPTVRWEIAKNVGGKELRPLAMPLVNAAASEEEEEIRSEMFRALGRVGSDNAVSALIKASEPVGLLKGRRTAAQRAAAAEGLVAAGGERAIDALRVLAADRDKHVRAVALKGLEELTSLEAE
jgi:HEAT repeat protein